MPCRWVRRTPKSAGVGKFEATDSAKEKITYLYRLLVHDKLIQPLAKGQEKRAEYETQAGPVDVAAASRGPPAAAVDD